MGDEKIGIVETLVIIGIVWFACHVELPCSQQEDLFRYFSSRNICIPIRFFERNRVWRERVFHVHIYSWKFAEEKAIRGNLRLIVQCNKPFPGICSRKSNRQRYIVSQTFPMRNKKNPRDTATEREQLQVSARIYIAVTHGMHVSLFTLLHIRFSVWNGIPPIDDIKKLRTENILFKRKYSSKNNFFFLRFIFSVFSLCNVKSAEHSK